jgi:5-(carboxyamino)imidazole ribonucleotide mutase
MPGGVPVATVALDGAKNAGILAAQILGAFDGKLSAKLDKYKKELISKVEESASQMKKKGWKSA